MHLFAYMTEEGYQWLNALDVCNYINLFKQLFTLFPKIFISGVEGIKKTS